MSLEQAIQANTEALHALHALLINGGNLGALSVPTTTDPETAPEVGTEEQPKKVIRKKAAAPSSASTQTAPDNSTTSSPESSEETEYPYEVVKKAVLNLSAKTTKQTAIDVLARFGATRLQDVLPEHYGALMQKIEDVIAGGEV